MTKDTPPQIPVFWEAIPEGIELWFAGQTFRLPMMTVRELRDDMIEANFLARGLEKVECLPIEVRENDKMELLGVARTIKNILAERHHIVLQTEADEFEVRLQADVMITVWREIQ